MTSRQRHASYILEIDDLWFVNDIKDTPYSQTEIRRQRLKSPFAYFWIENHLEKGFRDFAHAINKDIYNNWNNIIQEIEPYLLYDPQYPVMLLCWQCILRKLNKSVFELPQELFILLKDHL